MTRTRTIAAVALVVYVGAIVLANYFIVHGLPFGLSTPTPFGTYTVPVGFGLVAPAGTWMIAVSWPARDLIQAASNRWWGIAAIVIGAVVSWWVSSPAIALASGGTLLVSESVDMLLWTPLRRRFVFAVFVSSVVAACVDSVLFLTWAGLGYSTLSGLIVGKIECIVLIGAPASFLLRRQFTPPELVPA